MAVAAAFFFFFTVKAMRHDLLPWLSFGYSDYYFTIPFVGGEFLLHFSCVSAAMVLALGLGQTVGESVHGTWMFLLHRPQSSTCLIGVKLLVGAVLYLVCAGAAILAYSWWAAAPGAHASPFAWSMTVPVWKVWITMPLLYLGAFLSGIRPARWFGTRLLPLAASGAVVLLLCDLRWWPLCGLGLTVLFAVVLVGSIFFVMRTRDF